MNTPTPTPSTYLVRNKFAGGSKNSQAAEGTIFDFVVGYLSACHIWGDVVRAQRVAAILFALDPLNSAAHVSLGNTYGAAGMWKEQLEIWTKMRNLGIKKTPGATWVSVDGKTEMFYVDSNHTYLLLHLLF